MYLARPLHANRYPRLQRLLELKRQHVDASASPSTYLAADLRQSLTPPPPSHLTGGPFHLATLIPVKYDVVLIDAPLSCYGGFHLTMRSVRSKIHSLMRSHHRTGFSHLQNGTLSRAPATSSPSRLGHGRISASYPYHYSQQKKGESAA